VFSTAQSLRNGGLAYNVDVVGDCGDETILGYCSSSSDGYGRDVTLTKGQTVRVWLHSEKETTAPKPYAFSIRGPIKDVAPAVVLSKSYERREISEVQDLEIPFDVAASRFVGAVDLSVGAYINGGIGLFKLEHDGVSEMVEIPSSVSSSTFVATFKKFGWVEAGGHWVLKIGVKSSADGRGGYVTLSGPLSLTMKGPAW
jgi:hypothetical protein